MKNQNLRWIAREIAKRNWYEVVERPNSPVLDWDGHVSTANNYFSSAIGSKLEIKGFVFFNNKLMVDMDSHKEINEHLLKKYKTDKKYLIILAEKMEKECDELRESAKLLDKNDPKSLLSFFDKFNRVITNFRWVYNAGEVMEKIVKESIEKPLKKNFITKFNLELDSIKKSVKADKEIETAVINKDLKKIKNSAVFPSIQKFLDDFAWMRNFHHQGEFLDFDSLVEELRNTLDIALKQEDDNKNILEDIKILQHIIFLRTHISESNAFAGAEMKLCLEMLAKKFNLKYDDLTFLQQKEIIEMINTDKLPLKKEEIQERKKGYACINIDKSYYFISGKELEKLCYFYNYFNMGKNENKEITAIKGTTANPGFVRAIAKVITNVNEFHKLNKGEILIANSTTPNYMPIMGKASAFITDEGGITCHAAIVSREMNKPCIIGLKNATKIFRDGDLIEVDADKGIVRKL